MGDEPVGLDGAVATGRAFFDSAAQRGKSERGDKIILDAAGPSIDALADHAERGEKQAAPQAAAERPFPRGVEGCARR